MEDSQHLLCARHAKGFTRPSPFTLQRWESRGTERLWSSSPNRQSKVELRLPGSGALATPDDHAAWHQLGKDSEGQCLAKTSLFPAVLQPPWVSWVRRALGFCIQTPRGRETGWEGG